MPTQYTDSLELREERSHIASRIAERSVLSDKLHTPEARMEFFNNLDADGFVDLITYTNRILTKNHDKNVFIDENYNHIIDDDDPIETFNILPAPEDKVPLLKYLYEKARFISETQQTSPEHVAALVGFGLNAIHPFKEGNGRTARTLYALLSSDDNDRAASIEKAEYEALQGHLYLDPSTFRKPLFHMMQETLGTHRNVGGELIPMAHPAISSRTPYDQIRPVNRPSKRDTSQLVGSVFRDQFIAPMVTSMLSFRDDISCLNEIIGNHQGMRTFDISTFIKKGSKKDMRILRDAYRAISNEYVMTLIDVMGGIQLGEDRMIIATHEYGACAAKAPFIITALARGDLTFDTEAYATLAEKAAANNITCID